MKGSIWLDTVLELIWWERSLLLPLIFGHQSIIDPNLMFCIKKYIFAICFILHKKVFVPYWCTYSGLAVYIIIYSVSIKTFAIKMNSRLAVYSKTISELLWQGLQVITVQLCMIFLFVRRRRIKWNQNVFILRPGPCRAPLVWRLALGLLVRTGQQHHQVFVFLLVS